MHVLCISFRPQKHYHPQALVPYPPKVTLDVLLVVREQKSNWSAEAYKQVGPSNCCLISQNANMEKGINVGVFYAGNDLCIMPGIMFYLFYFWDISKDKVFEVNLIKL